MNTYPASETLVPQLQEAAEQAARRGGEVLQEWRGKFATRAKGPQDLVTDADLAAQAAVREILLKAFPTHAFLGEESPNLALLADPERLTWVVDPLDGTTNYVHGFPCYATSVAVTQGGRVLAGAMFDPSANELFSAGLGLGATLNGQPIGVTHAARLDEALVAVSLPPQCTAASPDVQDLLAVIPRAQAIRRTGSAALNLAYVACGRLDAHWASHIHPWDVAAGLLMIAEAGGVVTAHDGGPFNLAKANFLAASSAALHQDLLRTLTRRE